MIDFVCYGQRDKGNMGDDGGGAGLPGNAGNTVAVAGGMLAGGRATQWRSLEKIGQFFRSWETRKIRHCNALMLRVLQKHRY